jgi:hypothetical protein
VPPGLSCSEHHLERPTRSTIAQVQRQQSLTTSRAHRSEIGQSQARTPSNLEGEQTIRKPGVRRPRASRSNPCAHHQIRLASLDVADEQGERNRIE